MEFQCHFGEYKLGEGILRWKRFITLGVGYLFLAASPRLNNRFVLISRLWDLSISCHATWFTFEFMKTQTLMSILYHSTLFFYRCSTLTVILSCSTPVVYLVHTLARHYLFFWHLNDSTLTIFLTQHLLHLNTCIYITLSIYC